MWQDASIETKRLKEWQLKQYGKEITQDLTLEAYVLTHAQKHTILNTMVDIHNQGSTPARCAFRHEQRKRRSRM